MLDNLELKEASDMEEELPPQPGNKQPSQISEASRSKEQSNYKQHVQQYSEPSQPASSHKKNRSSEKKPPQQIDFYGHQ